MTDAEVLNWFERRKARPLAIDRQILRELRQRRDEVVRAREEAEEARQELRDTARAVR